MQARADVGPSSDDSDVEANELPDSVWEDVEEELTLEDAAALEAFMAPDAARLRQRTLGDVIAEKLAQKQQGAAGAADRQALSVRHLEHRQHDPLWAKHFALSWHMCWLVLPGMLCSVDYLAPRMMNCAQGIRRFLRTCFGVGWFVQVSGVLHQVVHTPAAWLLIVAANAGGRHQLCGCSEQCGIRQALTSVWRRQPQGQQDMDPQLEELFRGVGTLLTRYKSGKLPKAFKIIPSLQNWQQARSCGHLNCKSPAAARQSALCPRPRLEQHAVAGCSVLPGISKVCSTC